jgi:hypothetical protein
MPPTTSNWQLIERDRWCLDSLTPLYKSCLILPCRTSDGVLWAPETYFVAALSLPFFLPSCSILWTSLSCAINADEIIERTTMTDFESRLQFFFSIGLIASVSSRQLTTVCIVVWQHGYDSVFCVCDRYSWTAAEPAGPKTIITACGLTTHTTRRDHSYRSRAVGRCDNHMTILIVRLRLSSTCTSIRHSISIILIMTSWLMATAAAAATPEVQPTESTLRSYKGREYRCASDKTVLQHEFLTDDASQLSTFFNWEGSYCIVTLQSKQPFNGFTTSNFRLSANIEKCLAYFTRDVTLCERLHVVVRVLNSLCWIDARIYKLYIRPFSDKFW